MATIRTKLKRKKKRLRILQAYADELSVQYQAVLDKIAKKQREIEDLLGELADEAGEPEPE